MTAKTETVKSSRKRESGTFFFLTTHRNHTTMERLFILALLVINVQLVVADCDFDIVACVDSYNNCVAAAEGAGNSPADICTCYGTLLLCYRDAGCMSESDYNNTVQDCPNSRGCTIQQCLGIADTPIDTPVSEPVTFTPVASSTCNNTVADACLSNYFTCVGSGSQDKICNCYGPYLYCYFYDAGCLTLDDYDNAVQQCEQFNCTAEQCTSPISSPISYTPVDAPVSSCNFNDVVPCQDRFINCTTEAQSGNETCDCYGPYLNCVYDTGCITLESYWNAVQSCEQSGCSLEQCTDNGPVTPPVDAPYYTPYSEPVNNSTCSQSATMECYDTMYQPCWNGTDFCECYGPYLYCLYELQCFNNTEYSNIINSCTQNGCSYQQCANTGLTPVEPPQTTVPVSEPTSVSPINAPFAPPTAVICLQPWELVLIVVGSVLAGIGLAAIVGVIIYLSRGSSAKKTSTKYAKLQNY